MYKSKFTYFGQTGLILLVGPALTVSTLLFLVNYLRLESFRLIVLFVGLFFLLVLVWIWNKILTEMNQVTITDSSIEIKNPFTRRTKKIEKQRTKGFKDIFKNGYTILLIDNNDKVIAKLHDYYYRDFKGLRDNLGIKYLDRVPTFWDKIIKIEVEK
jgi:hypothetical protein